MKKFYIFLLIVSILPITKLSAQYKEISLWPNGAPGSEGKASPEKVRVAETGDHVVSSIHSPSITPFLPAPGKANGTAVIIAPGGGHRELWIDHEGYNPAKWLSERGVTAFVLKYRLAKEEKSTYTIDEHELADIRRAIRMIRTRAKEWNIDTARIGVMGFSAGGEVAALSAMRAEKGDPSAKDVVERESSRPAFQALIYPGGSARFEVSKNSPPVFLLGGYGDRPDIAEGLARFILNTSRQASPPKFTFIQTPDMALESGRLIRVRWQGGCNAFPNGLATWVIKSTYKCRDEIYCH